MAKLRPGRASSRAWRAKIRPGRAHEGAWMANRGGGRTDGRKDGRTDVWKFTPVSYRTSALWGRCPKRVKMVKGNIYLNSKMLVTESGYSVTNRHANVNLSRLMLLGK